MFTHSRLMLPLGTLITLLYTSHLPHIICSHQHQPRYDETCHSRMAWFICTRILCSVSMQYIVRPQVCLYFSSAVLHSKLCRSILYLFADNNYCIALRCRMFLQQVQSIDPYRHTLFVVQSLEHGSRKNVDLVCKSASSLEPAGDRGLGETFLASTHVWYEMRCWCWLPCIYDINNSPIFQLCVNM